MYIIQINQLGQATRLITSALYKSIKQIKSHHLISHTYIN